MKFREIIDYPISAREVFRHLSNEQFFVKKYEMLGCTHINIEHAEFTEKHISITMSRQAPVTMHIPSYVPIKVPDHITLVQTDTWDLTSWSGKVEVRFHHLPVHITATMSISETNGRAIERIDCEAQVNIPLIKHKLEELLIRDLRKDFAKEREVVLEIMGCTLEANEPA